MQISYQAHCNIQCTKNETTEEWWTYSNNQLNAQILLFYNNMYLTLQSSTCFEDQHAHLQEDKLYYHNIWYRQSLKTAVQYAGWEQTEMLW